LLMEIYDRALGVSSTDTTQPFLDIAPQEMTYETTGIE
jgi:hypothetical protein